MKTKSFNITLVILRFLLLVLSINALVGGALLIMRSDGSLLGMTLDYLSNTPFSNYTLPGLFLFTCVGILSMIAFWGMLKSNRSNLLEKLNLYKRMYWPWSFTFYAGLSTLIWIAVQILITEYFWIQPIILGIGIGILLLLLTPGIVKEFEKSEH